MVVKNSVLTGLLENIRFWVIISNIKIPSHCRGCLWVVMKSFWKICIVPKLKAIWTATPKQATAQRSY